MRIRAKPVVRRTLTRRQVEVIRLVADGHENKQIAAMLGIGEPAVKALVSRLLGKYGLPNRASLATAATIRQVLGETHTNANWLGYLFQEAPVMIALVRGPALTFELVNPAYARAVGERQLIGKTIREAFPEFAGAGIIEELERAYLSGESVVGHDYPSVRRTPDGNVERAGFVNFVWHPVRGGSGQVEGLITFGIDATSVVDAATLLTRST